MEELQRIGDRQSSSGESATSSVSAQLSPIETSFATKGLDVKKMRELSQGLLGSALTARQESEALTDLLERFPSESGMTPIARGTLLTLLFSHRSKLTDAVEQEQQLLHQLAAILGTNPTSDDDQREVSTLSRTAELNLALCEELSFGGNAHARSSETILADLATTVAVLRSGARQAQFHPNSISAKGRE